MTGCKTTVFDEDGLRRAVERGAEAYVRYVAGCIAAVVGGSLDARALAALNPQQVTLWGYLIFRDEVMDGGFVQLIHNGYGDFFFRNPFARAMEAWGLPELARIVKKAHRYYGRCRAELTRECGEDEFMALFERHPEFDALDDAFVEAEEAFTAAVARHVEAHLTDFVPQPGEGHGTTRKESAPTCDGHQKQEADGQDDEYKQDTD